MELAYVSVVVCGVLGLVWKYTSNFQLITLWLGSYFEQIDNSLDWQTYQNLITPKSQTIRQYLRLSIVPAVIIFTILDTTAGFYGFVSFIFGVITAKILLQSGQKFYIDYIRNSLSVKIEIPNKYDKVNKEALKHTRDILDGYVKQSDMKNLTLAGIKQFLKAGSSK